MKTDALPIDAPLAAALNIFPNPSSGSSTIAFHLDREASVSLSVYDQAGRLVTILVNTKLAAGDYYKEAGEGIVIFYINISKISEAM